MVASALRGLDHQRQEDGHCHQHLCPPFHLPFLMFQSQQGQKYPNHCPNHFPRALVMDRGDRGHNQGHNHLRRHHQSDRRDLSTPNHKCHQGDRREQHFSENPESHPQGQDLHSQDLALSRLYQNHSQRNQATALSVQGRRRVAQAHDQEEEVEEEEEGLNFQAPRQPEGPLDLEGGREGRERADSLCAFLLTKHSMTSIMPLSEFGTT
ncbi:hypothetical protein HPB48_004574 [Haemaphysalis longicornis]|uniref:Uncharacterized protein n=1 Tax=Haemaphysalis longicornis TaxID=44386 RepID=A0A9J6FEW9_HAELO|nr:hypothetical protein HPB48_004574 [Haemaphysalis longicornis]